MSEQQSSVPVQLAPQPDVPPVPTTRRHRTAVWAWTAVGLTMAAAVSLLGYFAWDDSRSHQQTSEQMQRADDLTRQVALLKNEGARLDSQLIALKAENGRLQTQARNPTLAMWNSCGGPCTMSPGAVRVGSVPDTFQVQMNFTADVPVRTYIFTFHQWTQFDGCGFSVRCVTGSYRAFDATTSLSQTVDEAEGCSGYVWVLQSDRAGTIKPDVKVRYQPADHPTGICAANP